MGDKLIKLSECISPPTHKTVECKCKYCGGAFQGQESIYTLPGSRPSESYPGAKIVEPVTRIIIQDVCDKCRLELDAKAAEEARLEAEAERFKIQARASGMPLSTGGTHAFMTFLTSEGNVLALAAARQFVSDKREHHFITLVGEPGRGKTHLALATGWQWLGENNGAVRYWQVAELLDAMRHEYNQPPKDDYGLARPSQFDVCKAVSLLILDDLGVEKTSDWVVDRLDTLINHRWLEQKCTLFTTNMAPTDLQWRIRSRIKEGVVVTLKGQDYRELKAKARRQ